MTITSSFDSLSISILEARYTVVSTEWDRCPLHTDAFSRLYVVDKGIGKVWHRDRNRVLYPQHSYLIPAGTMFRNIPSPGLGHYWIHFTARLPAGFKAFDVLECPLEVTLSPEGEPFNQARRLMKLMASGDTKNLPPVAVESQALARLLLLPFIAAGVPSRTIRYEGVNRFLPVLHYIDEHLSEPIRVEEIAALINIHPNYFSGRFAEFFGSPPLEYVLRKRIEKSQRLLWTTDQPLKEIALQVGYDDPAYFSRLFKKRTGVTPGRYRKQRQILKPETNFQFQSHTSPR